MQSNSFICIRNTVKLYIKNTTSYHETLTKALRETANTYFHGLANIRHHLVVAVFERSFMHSVRRKESINQNAWRP